MLPRRSRHYSSAKKHVFARFLPAAANLRQYRPLLKSHATRSWYRRGYLAILALALVAPGFRPHLVLGLPARRSHRFEGDSVPRQIGRRAQRRPLRSVFSVNSVLGLFLPTRKRSDSLRRRPLKTQAIPVGIADVQLLHAVGRDFGLFHRNATRTETAVRRIHVRNRSKSPYRRGQQS